MHLLKNTYMRVCLGAAKTHCMSFSIALFLAAIQGASVRVDAAPRSSENYTRDAAQNVCYNHMQDYAQLDKAHQKIYIKRLSLFDNMLEGGISKESAAEMLCFIQAYGNTDDAFWND